jgi:methionyl-tRNA formyltransferase
MNRNAKLRLVFFGTPEFALPSLDLAIASDLNVVAVVTQPDKPKGRGMRVAPPPVKVRALELSLPVLQPQRVDDPEFLAAVSALEPDVAAVVAFGRIIPQSLLKLPRLGVINVHPSFLPLYRGASPIQQALLDGAAETGVSTMYLDEGMDTGDVILQVRTPIHEEEDAGSLHDRLAELGANLLLDTLHRVAVGTAPRMPQNHTLATVTRRLKREDGLLRWDGCSRALANQVRAFSPWPGAYTFRDGGRLKVWRAQAQDVDDTEMGSGYVKSVDNEGIQVVCGRGTLRLQEVQPENAKRMRATAYAHGYRIERGTRFTDSDK